MLKSTAGGGGIGMQQCAGPDDLARAFEAVRELAGNNFGDSGVFLERLIKEPRHVEVQAFGDGAGNVVTLGDRDCSLQRRHQKVIEECPAPGIPEPIRDAMQAQARKLLESVSYANAATVEFLYDAFEQNFYFLEVNTRLQVEHGVTEEVYGVDLVEWMVRQAAGERIGQPLPPLGHAVQARVYAENPLHDFRPAPGRITDVIWPATNVRIDAWVQPGSDVSPYFDPMLGKIIAHAESRDLAIKALDQALSDSRCYGVETNLNYLRSALSLPAFVKGEMSTASLGDIQYQPATLEVMAPGPYTTIQSFPGRQGYWSVGVPPSGPMDDLSFRLANQLLGNASDCAGLEIVVAGPTLQFNCDTSIAIVGDCECLLDDDPCSTGRTVDVRAGQTLTVGRVISGCRAYLCFSGGLDLPVTLGSTATFTLGNMGGLHGRTLNTGDTLHLNRRGHAAVASCEMPDYASRHILRILLGPHTNPDFFDDDFMDSLVETQWTVHYNSSRTGVRLTGPQPGWAREDGGEAGLHPSNIHDNAYAFGSIDFTGDMPVILGPDGPSLGGFVCPGVVINADRWKIG
ncbi:MAG: 5-oxoprolinase/urea amidolyase family protein, partial [Pseudomonadota bacterium]